MPPHEAGARFTPVPHVQSDGAHMDSRELQALISERNETPVRVGSADALELFRFADGTEVIVTNAGLVTEDAEGWAHLREKVMSVSGE